MSLAEEFAAQPFSREWWWFTWQKYGRFILLGVGVGMVIWGVVLGVTKEQKQAEVVVLKNAQEKKEFIVVDVAGAVAKPGVYQLPAGARVGEAIEKAGGFSQEADLDWVAVNLNLARQLEDGEKIFVPKKGQTLGVKAERGQSSRIGGKINLNTASVADLTTLPGIGPKTAQRIVEYRRLHGSFKSLQELLAVPGIGPKTLEKLKPYLRL